MVRLKDLIGLDLLETPSDVTLGIHGVEFDLYEVEAGPEVVRTVGKAYTDTLEDILSFYKQTRKANEMRKQNMMDETLQGTKAHRAELKDTRHRLDARNARQVREGKYRAKGNRTLHEANNP